MIGCLHRISHAPLAHSTKQHADISPVGVGLFTNRIANAALIVAPTALLASWSAEFKRW